MQQGKDVGNALVRFIEDNGALGEDHKLEKIGTIKGLGRCAVWARTPEDHEFHKGFFVSCSMLGYQSHFVWGRLLTGFYKEMSINAYGTGSDVGILEISLVRCPSYLEGDE